MSEAGHDAASVAALAPVAMLFVHCLGGVSHHPAESVEMESLDAAIGVMERFLSLLETASPGSPGRGESA